MYVCMPTTINSDDDDDGKNETICDNKLDLNIFLFFSDEKKKNSSHLKASKDGWKEEKKNSFKHISRLFFFICFIGDGF